MHPFLLTSACPICVCLRACHLLRHWWCTSCGHYLATNMNISYQPAGNDMPFPRILMVQDNFARAA